MSLTDHRDQLIRFSSRNIARCGNIQYAYGDLFIAPANHYLVSSFHGMSGFCRSSIEQDKARVAKLLGYCPARAKAAEFKEDIEAHAVAVALPAI